MKDEKNNIYLLAQAMKLERMDGHSQAQFLRFVWARDRLPLTDEGFKESKFRITEMRRRGAMDRCLPEAATCSFTNRVGVNYYLEKCCLGRILL